MALLLLFSIAVHKGWYQVNKRKLLAVVWGIFLLVPIAAIGSGMLAEYQDRAAESLVWAGSAELCGPDGAGVSACKPDTRIVWKYGLAETARMEQ